MKIKTMILAAALAVTLTGPAKALGLDAYAEWEDRNEATMYLHGIMSGLEMYCGASVRPEWEGMRLWEIDEALQQHARSILPNLTDFLRNQDAVVVIAAKLYPHDQMNHCLNRGGGAAKIIEGLNQ